MSMDNIYTQTMQIGTIVGKQCPTDPSINNNNLTASTGWIIFATLKLILCVKYTMIGWYIGCDY